MSDIHPPSADEGPARSDREKILEGFMALLAEHRFERIGLGDIARASGISLSQLRREFSSPVAIVAAYMKEIDLKVLSGGDADMAEESPREKLFDVLMRRLDLLAPHKRAIRSLLRSAACNPPLALVLAGFGAQSQRWMLAASDIDSAGLKGMMRAQGLTMLFACVLRTWVDDEDPGLARTMAVLDRELSRGQRWSGCLDRLCAIPEGLSRIGSPRPRRRRGRDGDPVAA
ncbi:MAG: TetR/AcrR family transcriptional regulator [Pseudorhodoplanes sp.]|nr:MAG: TetR/AcrR family transcriptional regulator [Pseudorhodoplanes sp.]